MGDGGHSESGDSARSTRMAGRRSCVNSMWSGTERVRIGERLKATLAGVLELDLLRCQHLERIDAALDNKDLCILDQQGEGTRTESLDHVASNQGAATSLRQQVTPPSDIVLAPGQSSLLDSGGSTGDGPDHSRVGGGGPSRWSTLSWDASSDLLSPPTPDPDSAALLDCDSRPSSGFYSVSGSSLSDSCYSVSSEVALGLPGGLTRPLRLWEQRPLSADHSDAQWPEPVVQKETAASSDGAKEAVERRPVSTGDLEANGLSFLSDLCSSLCDPVPSSFLPLFDPSSSPHLCPQLDPRFCTNLVSRRTKEVYPYPSPLHAVALQSPLFNSLSPDPSPSASPDSPQADEPPTPVTTTTPSTLDLQPPQSPAPPSLTQLEQYITRLVWQYHSRMASTSCSDLIPAATPGPPCHRGLRTPAQSHGSTQSLSAFESRSTPSTLSGGSVTPCKSTLGNSGRVSLSSIGKRASRNSINLGNLPSATGEDVSINLHLNLNLNLTPSLNASLGLVENPKSSGVSGPLKSDFGTGASTASSSSLSASAPTPGLRPRPRISTCPSSLSHRSSMEVTGGSGAGSAFSRSLDWGGASPGVFQSSGSGCGPVQPDIPVPQDSSSSLKVSEDSAMVGEISRLSGLPRAVVVGLMEQGVELDVDCFQSDAERRGPGPGVEGRLSTQTEPQHEYSRVHLRVGSDQNLSRPIQLSLSVTPSPQSHSGLTPPLSHSPQSHLARTPPLSHSPKSQSSSSPIHPYQSAPIPTHRHSYSHYQHYQQSASPSDFPSSTASSPASRPGPRVRSPPRPLQPSPLGSTPLSVFRRDAPSQCSLPRVGNCGSPLGGGISGGIRPRGGSLRQGPVGGGGGGGWRRADGEGLYQGKHASRELVRASTISSFAQRENSGTTWGEEMRTAAQIPGKSPKKTPSRLWKGFEGRFWGKEEDGEREEDRWRRESEGSRRKDHQRVKGASGSREERERAESSSTSSSKRRGRSSWDKRSSSLRLSRRALFRSESQGLLEPRAQREVPLRGPHWVSSLDVGRFGLELHSEQGVSSLGGRRDGKRLSSTASLFHLSRSQSLEGSCHSLSSPPLSSPSFSPSPPPRAPLTRSHSLRDLGRRVFGSMRSLSLKHKTARK